VRGHVKASIAGSTQGSGLRRGLFGLVCLCVLGLAAFLGISAPSAGAQACPNAGLRTGPSGNLPDCRAYEQVSPQDKNGSGELIGMRSTPDGNGVAFISFNAFSDSPSDVYIAAYHATRSADGWSTQGVSPPSGTGLANLFDEHIPSDWSADLSTLITTTSDPIDPGDQDTYCEEFFCGFYDVYLSRAGGDVTWISHGATVPDSYQTDAVFAGANPDLTHVLFETEEQLVPGAPANVTNLYEWVGGNIRLVGISPGGTPLPTGARLGSVSGGYYYAAQPAQPRAVSADGSRIFFTSGGKLYVRENDTTVQVDAPGPGAPGPGGGGQFWTASTDGSKVFFTADASRGLTNDTVASSGQNLYRYDVDTGALTDLTPAATAQVQGVSGVSDDGSYLYFVANGNLASGATQGQRNLYVVDGGTTTFIATLNTNDSSNWAQNAQDSTARVTPDGQHLVFQSHASLKPGFNNAGHTEIYEYNFGPNSLECASCNPSTNAATGDAQMVAQQSFLVTSLQAPRNVTNDGSRVFFTTSEALVPDDVNGKKDVYEYEDGAPQLISTGRGDADSVLVDNSTDGRDVFFITRDSLTWQDIDGGATDVYDARVNGGVPEPEGPPSCSGETCKPPALGAPSTPGAGSQSFSGPGNLSQKQNCNKPGKEAKKLSNRSKQLRRNANKARKAGNSARAKQLNKKANRLAKQARNKSKSAKKCRKRNRGTSK
jgi:hypothetical protein